ncbi:DUF1499 domain-containing protein [Candidatus Nitrotoga sp. M5]|uniref:DUF1499 domain-containing protein n=1 Tax=Candidatus Nitrotoga sp. M5 TaxID=2890409 RepID=UPI001EF2DAFA|nr:DUF1499 domain-containing protein [Candidatus Nitrotoga sp. M5]CAH1385233.1 conserved hypothetical protein [Candidatus Nitrotoga sp. M5]
MIKIIRRITILLFTLTIVTIIAGQAGLFNGKRPTDLGLHDGKLKAPLAKSFNSISSQAAQHPHSDYHIIAPLTYQGDGKAAFVKLTNIVRNMNNTTVIVAEPTYLYAEFRSSLMKFTDDVEFALDDQAGVINMRSASRLGKKDFGTNRKRLEAIRAAFESGSTFATTRATESAATTPTGWSSMESGS